MDQQLTKEQHPEAKLTHLRIWHRLIATIETAALKGKSVVFEHHEDTEDDDNIYVTFNKCDCPKMDADHFVRVLNKANELRKQIEG